MSQTQTDPGNSSKQAPSIPVKEEQILTPQPKTSQAQPPPQKPKRRIPKHLLILGAIALFAGVGYGVYGLFFYQPEPEGLFLSGRIEGYETDISAKIGGRIADVYVREGDVVKPNQLLVQINDAEVRAQLRRSAARVRAAQERLEKARQQMPVLQAQLQQAKLTTQQAGQESQGRVLEAENALAAARFQLAEAQENLTLAAARQRRTSQLFVQGAVSAQQRDEDNAALGVATRVAAAQEQVKSSQGRLTQAQATRRNQPIRAAVQIQAQIAQARTDIAVSQQEVGDAKATQAEIQANLNYLAINSPLTGNVITRYVEPGEVVAAGAPLLTIVNLDI